MIRYLSLIFVLLCLISGSQAANQTVPYGKIPTFKASDVPFDDGSGVVLSWKPLPREMRIIMYRVYRGISPDTLYNFGQVDVDPNAGVAAETMYYYDKDYQLLLSIDSPARLKKEKQQSPRSPLYQKVPRDPKILSNLLRHYTVLGIADQANIYKHSRKIISSDGTVSAGLKPTQFEQLAANPIPGEKYYYTVVAVNEKGIYLPYADIQSVIPFDNPPDNISILNSVFLTDTKEFRLEWIPAFSSTDIAQWQFWLLPKTQSAAFENWQKIYIAKEGISAPWTANAVMLAEKPNDYNNYLTIQTKTGRTFNPDGSLGAELSLGNLQDYSLVLAAQDYSGYFSYAMGMPTQFIKTSDLPPRAVFSVTDKPDDKGDTNTLAFGQSICYITQASYANLDRTKIRINYEISENIKYKIESLVFQVLAEDGKVLGKINESYPDKIIYLKVPKGSSAFNKLQIKVAFKFKGSKRLTDYYLHQNLSYDSQTKRFTSKDIFFKQENLSQTYYQIFRKNLLESGFMPVKKLVSISRSYDDIINYESTLDRLVTGVDSKTGRLLIDPTLTFALDAKTGMPLSVNIYKAEEAKALKKMQNELVSLRKSLLSNPAKADSIRQVIADQEAYLNALTRHPAYLAASKQANPKSWLRIFHKEQLKNSRTYSYLIMKTDNKGAYSLSDESKPFQPIANWFNMNFLIALIASLAFTIIVIYSSIKARRGGDLYLRPIAGLSEIDNAVGRATEMGRPILYVPGWSTIGEITTIASMMILNRVGKKTAEYDTRLLVPNCDYLVMPLAQEMVREAYYEAGRPDSFNPVDIFYICNDQFPYAAGVNGTIIRERCATIFYMGFFNAEALLMTETGNAIGSIQIAGTDAITQVPFFITTCDYTLIGEEFYAASAYLSKDPELVSMLKAQDYFKFLIVFFILLGAILSTMHYNWLTNAFPLE
jgi:hypothetical protein